MPIIRQCVLVESSTVGDRKEFLDCLKFCVANRAALIIDTIDRAQRSFMEIPLLEKYRVAGKLEIHFARENIIISDKSTSSDILMWHQGVLMAEAYSLHFKENVRRSISTKVAKGEYPGMAPMGYKNIRTPDNRSEIIINEEIALLVVQLFTEYATGQLSLKMLVDYAYKIGLRTATGKPLAKGHLYHIIQNPFYYGTAKWGEFTFEHRYPRLIERDLWRRCQDVLRGRNTHPTSRWGSLEYLYRGLITDYYSGRIVTTERKKNKYNYLMTWDESGRHVAVNEDIVTGQISKILSRIQVSRETINTVTDYLKSAKDTEKDFHRRAMAEIQRDITQATNRRDNLVNLYLDGKIDDATYSTKHAELTDKLKALQEDSERHINADDGVNDTIVKIFRAAHNLSDNFLISSEVAHRRTMLKSIFRTLKLKEKTLCYDLNFPFNVLETITESRTWRTQKDSNSQPSDP